MVALAQPCCLGHQGRPCQGTHGAGLTDTRQFQLSPGAGAASAPLRQVTFSSVSPFLTGCSGGSRLPSLPAFWRPNPPQSLCSAVSGKPHLPLAWRPGVGVPADLSCTPVCGEQGAVSCRPLSETSHGSTWETGSQGGGGGGLPVKAKLGTRPGESGVHPCRPVWARLELCSEP